MGAVCFKDKNNQNSSNMEKEENFNSKEEEEKNILEEKIYSQNSNLFAQMLNYDQIKQVLNLILTKTEHGYWHEYETYLASYKQDIQKYLELLENAFEKNKDEGPKLLLDIQEGNIELPEKQKKKYEQLYIEISLSSTENLNYLKYNTQKVDIEKQQQQNVYVWHDFSEHFLQYVQEDPKQEKINQLEKEQISKEIEKQKTLNSNNSNNKSTLGIIEEEQNQQQQQQKSKKINFYKGAEKQSFSVRLKGIENGNKKKEVQIGDEEQFILFELLDQKVHCKNIEIVKKQSGKTFNWGNLKFQVQLLHNWAKFYQFWKFELSARLEQIERIQKYVEEHPRHSLTQKENRDKNQSILIDQLNSFISRQNSLMRFGNTQHNSSSNDQVKQNRSKNTSLESEDNSFYETGFYMK